jgi:hypothetical protein
MGGHNSESGVVTRASARARRVRNLTRLVECILSTQPESAAATELYFLGQRNSSRFQQPTPSSPESGTAKYKANVPPNPLSVSWADVRPIGSRSLSLEMMEWKRQYESNSRGVRNR